MSENDEFKDLSDEEIASYIESHRWIYAKTMPQCPHWYTLKKESKDQAMFERFVMHIRRYGTASKFFRKTLIYFRFGDYKYWSMGAPLDQTIRLKHVTGFSKLFENTEYRKAWESNKQIKLRKQFEEEQNESAVNFIG